jgi:hypothetical protein
MAGAVPWALTGWRSSHPPVWLAVFGGVLITAGTLVLLE